MPKMVIRRQLNQAILATQAKFAPHLNQRLRFPCPPVTPSAPSPNGGNGEVPSPDGGNREAPPSPDGSNGAMPRSGIRILPACGHMLCERWLVSELQRMT